MQHAELIVTSMLHSCLNTRAVHTMPAIHLGTGDRHQLDAPMTCIYIARKPEFGTW